MFWRIELASAMNHLTNCSPFDFLLDIEESRHILYLRGNQRYVQFTRYHAHYYFVDQVSELTHRLFQQQLSLGLIWRSVFSSRRPCIYCHSQESTAFPEASHQPENCHRNLFLSHREQHTLSAFYSFGIAVSRLLLFCVSWLCLLQGNIMMVCFNISGTVKLNRWESHLRG